MFADSRFDYLSRVRYYVSVAVMPLHFVASLPGRAAESMLGTVRSRDELAADNAELQEQLLQQQYQLQKLEYLTAENARLNDLLKASSTIAEEVVRVQLIGVTPDPFSKRVLINKGSRESVYVGQPVVDAYGLMGQVVEVLPLSSWVLLITDPQHGTPVQINRNGLRANAFGTRDSFHQLTLNNIPNTADIEVGDQLFTSGLDQTFPPGLPVGIVRSIYHDPGKPFADVVVTPTARIDRSSNLLLVVSDRSGRGLAPAVETTATELAPAVEGLAPTDAATATGATAEVPTVDVPTVDVPTGDAPPDAATAVSQPGGDTAAEASAERPGAEN
jgi:rod shape-determining protein MreC